MDNDTRFCALATCEAQLPLGARKGSRFCSPKCSQVSYYRNNRDRILAYQVQYSAVHAETKRRAAADWYAANKERAAESSRARAATGIPAARKRAQRLLDPDKYRQREKRWRDANLEQARAASRRYYLSHREESARANQAWADRNRERTKAIKKRWNAANLEATREAVRRRRARLRDVFVVSISAKQIADRVSMFGGVCWMCGGPFEHLDHVKPIALGGLHVLANLRPACAECNMKKSAQWYGPLETYRFLKN